MPRSNADDDDCCKQCFHVPELLKTKKYGTGTNMGDNSVVMNSVRDKRKAMTSKPKKSKPFHTFRLQKGGCGPFSWSYLPILVGLIPMLGFMITYYTAKVNCHVEKWIIPYVSYTGTRFPELMYFGLLLNLEGFFGFIIVFLAWRYYRQLGESGMLNNATLVVGSISCFGVVMVGNFPVTYSKIPHYTGAVLAFFLGTVFTILTAILSKRTSYRSSLKCIHVVKNARIVLSVVMSVSLSMMAIFAYIKKLVLQPQTVQNEAALLKRVNGSCPEYPNDLRAFDLFGALVEWLLTLGILVCLGLYAYEFKAFDNIKITLKHKNGQILQRCPTTEAETDHSVAGSTEDEEDEEEDECSGEEHLVISIDKTSASCSCSPHVSSSHHSSSTTNQCFTGSESV